MTYAVIALCFLFVEIILFAVVFRVFGRLFLKPDPSTKEKVGVGDFLKGMLERVVLSVALAKGIPQILIFFGAMKVATRLKTKSETAEFNDFFLVGNLTSVFVAIQYSIHLRAEMPLVQSLTEISCQRILKFGWEVLMIAC